jgi:hypothetical protein
VWQGRLEDLVESLSRRAYFSTSCTVFYSIMAVASATILLWVRVLLPREMGCPGVEETQERFWVECRERVGERHPPPPRLCLPFEALGRNALRVLASHANVVWLHLCCRLSWMKQASTLRPPWVRAGLLATYLLPICRVPQNPQ